MLRKSCNPYLETLFINCKPVCSQRYLSWLVSKMLIALFSRQLLDSDHCLVHFLPTYRQKLKTAGPVVKTVKRWSNKAKLELQAYFDCTDWRVFEAATSDLDGLTLAKEVRTAKRFCSEKLKNKFSANDPGSVWRGLQDITNYRRPSPLRTPHTLEITSFTFSPLVGATEHCTPEKAQTRTVFFTGRHCDEHVIPHVSYPTSLICLTDTFVKLYIVNTQGIIVFIVVVW